MTLLEMSVMYANSAQQLRERIRALRAAQRTADSRRARQALRRREAALQPLLREARELAGITAHYYDRKGEHYGKRSL